MEYTVGGETIFVEHVQVYEKSEEGGGQRGVTGTSVTPRRNNQRSLPCAPPGETRIDRDFDHVLKL